jgi:hypothetical protein
MTWYGFQFWSDESAILIRGQRVVVSVIPQNMISVSVTVIPEIVIQVTVE